MHIEIEIGVGSGARCPTILKGIGIQAGSRTGTSRSFLLPPGVGGVDHITPTQSKEFKKRGWGTRNAPTIQSQGGLGIEWLGPEPACRPSGISPIQIVGRREVGRDDVDPKE